MISEFVCLDISRIARRHSHRWFEVVNDDQKWQVQEE